MQRLTDRRKFFGTECIAGDTSPRECFSLRYILEETDLAISFHCQMILHPFGLKIRFLIVFISCYFAADPYRGLDVTVLHQHVNDRFRHHIGIVFCILPALVITHNQESSIAPLNAAGFKKLPANVLDQIPYGIQIDFLFRLLLCQRADFVESSPELERAGELQIFRLDIEVTAQLGSGVQGSPPGDALQSLLRVLYHVQGQHMMFPFPRGHFLAAKCVCFKRSPRPERRRDESCM